MIGKPVISYIPGNSCLAVGGCWRDSGIRLGMLMRI